VHQLPFFQMGYMTQTDMVVNTGYVPAPTFVQPVYAQPVYNQPVYSQPAFGGQVFAADTGSNFNQGGMLHMCVCSVVEGVRGLIFLVKTRSSYLLLPYLPTCSLLTVVLVTQPSSSSSSSSSSSHASFRHTGQIFAADTGRGGGQFYPAQSGNSGGQLYPAQSY
jgi:hypothetical protein